MRGDLVRPPLRGPLDGVWANASLLHVPRDRAADVLGTIVELLRPGAPLLVSLKRGTGEGMEAHPAYDGMAVRWFTYWQPEELDGALHAAGLRIVFRAERDARDRTWLVRIARR